VTVLDDLRVVEERIAARIAELEPLVQEYNELQQIAERLGIDRQRTLAAAAVADAKPQPAPAPAPTAPPKAAAKPHPAAKPKPAPKRRATKGAAVRRQPGGTQKAGAERRERMLNLIRESPGITVPELSVALETDAPSLYRVVRKLQSDGVVAKDGKSLKLVGEAPSAAG